MQSKENDQPSLLRAVDTAIFTLENIIICARQGVPHESIIAIAQDGLENIRIRPRRVNNVVRVDFKRRR